MRAPDPTARSLGIRRFVSRKWEIWLVPSWDSMPSAVKVYFLTAMIPALPIRRSNLSIWELTNLAAERTEARLPKSAWTKVVLMRGFSFVIPAMTGSIFEALRPWRRMWAGLA